MRPWVCLRIDWGRGSGIMHSFWLQSLHWYCDDVISPKSWGGDCFEHFQADVGLAIG